MASVNKTSCSSESPLNTLPEYLVSDEKLEGANSISLLSTAKSVFALVVLFCFPLISPK